MALSSTVPSATQSLEARPSRRSAWILAGLCFALSIIGWVAMGVIPSASTRDHGAYPLTGLAIVLGCFGAAAVFLRRGAGDVVRIRADASGLLVPSFSPQTIPWDAIIGFEWYRNGVQQIIRFALHDAAAFERATGPAAAMERLEGSSYGDFGVNMSYLDHNLDQLLAVLCHYRPDWAQG